MNIVLIGLSGTGKTTVGRLLALKTGRVFIDIDLAIEERFGVTVEELFRTRGESFFREQERELIHEVSEKDGLVVATGGGAVVLPENVTALKRRSVLVGLHASAEILLARLEKDQTVRPLLKKTDPLQAIQLMMEARADKYAVADITIGTENRLPETVVDEILMKMKDYES